MSEPIHAFGGADMRAEALRKALIDIIYERARGMPIPTILGVLRIIEHELMGGQ